MKPFDTAWDIIIITCAVLFIFGVIVGRIHQSDINRSLSDRVLLLEKQIHERVIPRINIEEATVYNGEGDITIEKVERAKKQK